MELKSKIESLLFVSLKPLSLKEMAGVLGSPEKDVSDSLISLINDYKEKKSGLAIIENAKRYQLVTSSENSEIIKEFLKDETSGELSQPSLEALTIIAYKGPIAKMELEKIRGVNCSLIIRNLLIRGLIEENFDKKKNENYYSVTHDFIRFLGINSINELPDYEKLNKLDTFNQIIATDNE